LPARRTKKNILRQAEGVIMAARASKSTDRERERQRHCREFEADHGSKWEEQYKPGTFGCHELLDRTAIATDEIERAILMHPACVRDEEWYALAEKAVSALQTLYQRVGAKHMKRGEAETS
jgi:hypothetical protein